MAVVFSPASKRFRSARFISLTSVVVFGLLSTVVGGILTGVTSGDHRLMRRVNRWAAPRWFQMWMIGSTRIGDGWLWAALALLVALYGGPKRFVALAASISAGAVGVMLFMTLKRAFSRRRPCDLMPHCWAHLLPPDQFSFPSGHTITAFAVAVSLTPFYPAFGPALFFAAASIAVSRILLGMHFMSDVVVGAAIGTVLARLALSYFG